MKMNYVFANIFCLCLFSISVFAQRLEYDPSFTPAIDGPVNFIEVLSDQKILIAGNFSTVDGVSRRGIARLNADGSLDTTFEGNWAAQSKGFGEIYSGINSMEVLPDGKILLGGDFGSGQPLEYRKAVLRLNPDGSFDSSLSSFPQVRGEGLYLVVRKAEQMPNGKILICGNFTLSNGNPQPKLARYNHDGTYDPTFTTSINGDCRDIEAQQDGKYLVAGNYSTVNGSPAVGLTRFNADDTVDAAFNASLMSYLQIELERDGEVIAMTYPRPVRLNADGSIRQTFPTKIDDPGDVALQPNGKAIVVANYSTDNGYGQSDEFNRFNSDGTHDPTSNSISFLGPSSPTNPKAVAVTAGGSVIAGGPFTSLRFNLGAAISRPYLVRLLPVAIPIKPKFDFDGDGKDDIAVYRPSDTYWYLNQSTSGFFASRFGLPQDKTVAADYDRDGRADIAIFRDGIWVWLRSSDSTFGYRVCGRAGDIPQPLDGWTGEADFLVFRPSDGKFYEHHPFFNERPADMRDLNPLPGDIPVTADYDGDGISDMAIFRNGIWRALTTGNLDEREYHFGLPGDIPVPADYDGDGRADYAVFRPSDGNWYVQRSAEGFYAVQWGLADDLPVPADYDGDGRSDIAVYRDGVWYQLRSTNSFYAEYFGSAGDVPPQSRQRP